jgi:hypothetical protein
LQFLINCARDNNPSDLSRPSKVLLDPTHVAEDLPDGPISSLAQLQFENYEIADCILGKDVDRANIDWILDAITSRGITIKLQFFSV